MKQKDIISFFIRHPEYFIKIVSLNYTFLESQLKKYKNVLNWDYISQNTCIHWSEEILSTFNKDIDWVFISTNEKAFSDLNLLKIFEERIDWKGKENVIGDSIASNEGLPWTIEFIELIESKIDFAKLSMNTKVKWSDALLNKYINRWDFTELACNESFPWSLNLFEKYLESSYLEYFPVKNNIALISNIDFIEKYKDFLDWSCICANSKLPWIELDLLKRWSKYLNWHGISQNKILFQNDRSFFYSHFDKWQPDNFRNFISLSTNAALPWSLDFIRTYKNYWDWENLSLNEGIPWSPELIDYFADTLIWGGWNSDDFGRESFDFGLIANESVPWSIEFLLRYENKLEFEAFQVNKAVWAKAFKSDVDDYVVDVIFRII